MRQVVDQRRATLDRLDPAQLAGQRREPELLGSRFVHEARIEVADHPLIGAGGRGRCRGLLGDRAQVRLDVVRELAEGAVVGSVRGDLGPREPAAVDETEQIVLRPHAAVEVREQQPGGR